MHSDRGTIRKPNAFSAFGNLKNSWRFKDLRSFDNFTGLDAAGAHLHLAIATGRQLNADRLKIRLEAPPGLVIRV